MSNTSKADVPLIQPLNPPGDTLDLTEHDDYARTRVPEHAKRGAGAVLSVLVGFVTAFFFVLVGGLFLNKSGATATWIALIVSFVMLIVLTLIVSHTAAKEGLTGELLTRGAGFGAAGSVLTTLIYAGTFVIYAATEGQILAHSIDQIWDLPDRLWYVIVAVIFLPMAWNGISSMTKIMSWTIILYVILLAWAIVAAWQKNAGMPEGFFTAMPSGAVGGVVGVVAIMSALAGTVGINPFEAADYNRFIRASDFKRKAIYSVVLPYALLFFGAIPLGMYFTLITHSADPSIYFVGLLGLIPGVVLAWVSQIRVNLTNLHVSSVAFTSGSEIVGAQKLGRRFWLLAVTVACIGLMWFDVLGNLYVFLQWTGIFLLSWVACVVADITVVRGLLKIVTGPIEYRTSKIRRYNLVGITALLAGVSIASYLWLAVSDPLVNGLCAYIGFAVAFVLHVVLAVATKGRTYFADSTDSRIAAYGCVENKA
ncbi:purine-cytosine permease family protein [Pseudomonas putida]